MILDFFKNIFKKDSRESGPPKDPQLGDSYGVVTGRYVGEFFVYVDRNDSNFIFLSLPSMKVREVPFDKYETGLKDNVIEFVERLPKVARKICELQYVQNKQNQDDATG